MSDENVMQPPIKAIEVVAETKDLELFATRGAQQDRLFENLKGEFSRRSEQDPPKVLMRRYDHPTSSTQEVEEGACGYDITVNYRIVGICLAQVEERSDEREARFQLYRSADSRYVCIKHWRTGNEGERSTGIYESVEDVVRFFGVGHLAKQLYTKVGLAHEKIIFGFPQSDHLTGKLLAKVQGSTRVVCGEIVETVVVCYLLYRSDNGEYTCQRIRNPNAEHTVSEEITCDTIEEALRFFCGEPRSFCDQLVQELRDQLGLGANQ